MHQRLRKIKKLLTYILITHLTKLFCLRVCLCYIHMLTVYSFYIVGLKVKSITPQCDENGPRLYTDNYESESLIVRRGSSFYLDIFHEGYNGETDEFYLQLKTGKSPKKRDGSLVEIKKGAPSKVYDYYTFYRSKDDF